MPLSSVVGAQSIVKPGVCTSSTRPASPFEGQMIYETDTDVLAIWNGTAWRQLAAATKTGSVLQVVNATTTSIVAVSSTTYIDSNLTATITPSSATSKIFVTTNQGIYMDTALAETGIRLVRNSTTLQTQVASAFTDAGRIAGQAIFSVMDSPATTSAITYKTQIARVSGSGNFYAQINSNPGNITLMEIAG